MAMQQDLCLSEWVEVLNWSNFLTFPIIVFCCNLGCTLSYYFIGNQNLRRRKKIIGQDPAELPVEDEPSKESGYFSALVLPFILHMVFMAATAFFIMHVQVWLLSRICTSFKIYIHSVCWIIIV